MDLSHGVREARKDGWVPIGDYAAVGDGRTVALVALDGRIDWWPVPTLDSPPVFAALLDPAGGGYLEIVPTATFRTERAYVDGTNVLQTTFHTDSGTVRVTDCLATGTGGRLPWNELSRRVEGVQGRVEIRWTVRPGSRFGLARPWTQQQHDDWVLHVGDQHLALRCFDLGAPKAGPTHLEGSVTVEEGHHGLLTVVASDAEPVFLPGRERLETRLDRTIARWQEWRDIELGYDGPWQEAVERSALALKLLTYTPTGAIAAAATTSLPERVGGKKNYDYRYAWVRDSSFALDSLIALGLTEEVHSSVSWLLATIRSTAPDIKVFYKLDGRVPGEQTELDAPGYRDTRPVRSGNSARNQIQLGTYGDLFDTVWRYVGQGHLLDEGTDRMLSDLADRCADQWMTRDSGLWELSDHQHYTISKIGCWVALDRALRMVEAGQLHSGHVEHWRTERQAIQTWVNEHCWSPSLGSYTFYAGTDKLDAATLLAGRTGFDRGDRLAGTVRAVRSQLAEGSLVYRYSGMQEEENAFVACSFWLADALALLGRVDEAEQVITDTLAAAANDVGLMSEQVDPSSRAALGNVPQALSHLALINAVGDWDSVRRGETPGV